MPEGRRALVPRERDAGAAEVEGKAARIEKGAAVRTRPLCVYPEVPRYDGRGALDKAESFATLEDATMRSHELASNAPGETYRIAKVVGETSCEVKAPKTTKVK